MSSFPYQSLINVTMTNDDEDMADDVSQGAKLVKLVKFFRFFKALRLLRVAKFKIILPNFASRHVVSF